MLEKALIYSIQAATLRLSRLSSTPSEQEHYALEGPPTLHE